MEGIAWTGLCGALFCSADAGHRLTVDDVWLVCDKAAISNQIGIVGNHQFIYCRDLQSQREKDTGRRKGGRLLAFKTVLPLKSYLVLLITAAFFRPVIKESMPLCAFTLEIPWKWHIGNESFLWSLCVLVHAVPLTLLERDLGRRTLWRMCGLAFFF